jgi:hypothetical protein
MVHRSTETTVFKGLNIRRNEKFQTEVTDRNVYIMLKYQVSYDEPLTWAPETCSSASREHIKLRPIDK